MQLGDQMRPPSAVFFCCSHFGAVADTAENCAEINSTTKYLTQNRILFSMENTRNDTVIKYIY